MKKLPALRGRTVINLFFEDSTRTRSSFEIAGKWLSADTINITGKGSSASKGESLRDTVRTITAMGVDALVMRHSASGAAQQVSEWVDAAVINAGDGTHEHPTQALLDAYTLQQRLGTLEGRQVAMVGDLTHSRVFRSNVGLLTMLGAARHRRRAADADAERRGHLGQGGRVLHLLRPRRGAAQGRRRDDAARPARADERRLLPQRAGVHRRLRPHPRPAAGCSAPTSPICHPGPMNRGLEIAADAADAAQSLVLEQVSAGVAVRMAILYHLLAGEETAA